MRIMGIDPGLNKMGWGVIEYKNNALKHIANGTLKTNSRTSLPERLAQLAVGLEDVITLWDPLEVAVEETFVNSNPQDALKLGQARGVALSTPAKMGIIVAEYAANKIKKTVVGAGHAQKEQVQMMMNVLMPGVQLHSADAADALACAVCHAHSRQSSVLETYLEKA